MSNKHLKYKVLNESVRNDDEFYTQLKDIKSELQNYSPEVFKDKIVYCNCDSIDSNFFKYFWDNKDVLGLRGIITTSIDKKIFKWSREFDCILEGSLMDGSFDSPECKKLIQECDIIVTNPPYSIFGRFLDFIISTGKKFIILAAITKLTTRRFVEKVIRGELFLGYNFNKSLDFLRPDKSYNSVNCIWFNNVQKFNKKLELTKTYQELKPPKYDNFDAVEISKVKNIPKDYYGNIGVPITFLQYYNPEEFKFIYYTYSGCTEVKINGRKYFARVIIQRVPKNN